MKALGFYSVCGAAVSANLVLAIVCFVDISYSIRMLGFVNLAAAGFLTTVAYYCHKHKAF